MNIQGIISKNKYGFLISIFIHTLILLLPFTLMVSPVIQKEIELFVLSDEKPPAPVIKHEKKKVEKVEKKEILNEEIIEPTVHSESTEAIPIAPPPPVEKPFVEYKAEPKDVEFGSSEGPRFYHREMPVYPFIARKLGKEGRVVLRLTIDERGRLLNLEVIEGAGYGFTESAIEAVRKSTFVPAKKDGKPILSRALLPIKYALRRTE